MPRFLRQTKEFRMTNPSERAGTSLLHRNPCLLACTGSNIFGPSLNKSLDTMTWPVICVHSLEVRSLEEQPQEFKHDTAA